MRKNSHLPLPEFLSYLQPFVRSLSKFPPDEWNEDIDPSGLDSVLRERIRGMDEETATRELDQDRERLEDWLKDSAPTDHPAYWVLGYLSSTKLAGYLIRPPDPPPRGPDIGFAAPQGWKVKVEPYALHLKKGKWLASIIAIDEFTFNSLATQHDHAVGRAHLLHPPGWIGSDETSDVAYGEVRGKKYVLKQSAPSPWKRVNYLLAVPGGFVSVTLDACGEDFDETLFESRYHTLRMPEPVTHHKQAKS